jgi:phospholipid/cholesterol/gamma-HCH transport system permease protein
MGVVLVLQSRPSLVQFGAGSYLPAVAAVSVVREIGPLITALVCAGKICSGISAELGSMRVSEQIDAMEVSGTNPFKYLVVTRILAGTLMIPLLVLYADTISLVGSFLGSNINGHISASLYFNQVFEVLEYSDLVPSIIKSVFFGFVIGLTGCYMGYNSEYGTEGVGRATNSSVVVSLLLVIVVDLVAVQITSLFTGTMY